MSHALIFGASGVSGWAIANQALSYPNSKSFSTVTALTNRPLSREDSCLPSDDSRLQLVSGIDLTGTLESIVSGLQTKVPNIQTVTHVFFAAFIAVPDYPELVRINTALVRNAITAIDRIAGSSLRAVVLQTGGKHYGVEHADKVSITAPLKEDAPRLTQPGVAENIFYYPQYDAVQALSAGKPWRFYEVRPDVIVGFTPGSNVFNITQGLGLYFSLYRAVHGDGSTVPFVGTAKTWTNTHTDTSQDILAEEEIYIALNAESIPSGTSFNAADSEEITTWEQKWPKLAAYFGLVGVGPGDNPVDVGAWAKQHESEWKEVARQHGLKEGIFERYLWDFISGVCIYYDFDRQFDLTRSRQAGFIETVPTVDGYKIAFDRMKAAKILP